MIHIISLFNVTILPGLKICRKVKNIITLPFLLILCYFTPRSKIKKITSISVLLLFLYCPHPLGAPFTPWSRPRFARKDTLQKKFSSYKEIDLDVCTD